MGQVEPFTGQITEHFSWGEADDQQGNDMPMWARRNCKVMARNFLEPLREAVGAPLKITSWYRSPQHSIEAAKEDPGVHTTGWAVDIACGYGHAYEILKHAPELGFTGIGVKQRGKATGRFLHLDVLHEHNKLAAPRPRVWSY